MNFISKAMGKLGLSRSLSGSRGALSTAATMALSDDPCTSCPDPCGDHEELPDALKAKIEGGDMVGSVKPYRRHMLICAGDGTRWAEHVEETKGYFATVARAAEEATSAAKDQNIRTIVTACDRDVFAPENQDGHATAAEGAESAEDVTVTDVIALPDFIRFTDLSAKRASEVVAALISTGKVIEKTADGKGVVAKGFEDGTAFVLVCTHKKRDKRCGVAGPMLMSEFQKVVEDKGLKGKILVHGVSHIGGHKYAGNVIVYSKEFPFGVWYGRVKTCHAEGIVQGTVIDGKVFKELYRGQGEGLLAW